MKRFSVVCAALCFVAGSVFAQQNYWNDRLIRAAQDGDMAALEQALDNGANVNYVFGTGRTALMEAAYKQNVQMVRVLLSRYAANPSQPNENKNESALLVAAGVDKNNTDVLRLLLEYGANVNEADNQKMTALMYAAQSGNLDNVVFLLDNGANVQATNNNGQDALILAVVKQKSNVVTKLLDYFPNFSLCDNAKKTAFIYAVEKQDTGMVRIFLRSSRFDVNKPSDTGVPPLLQAIQDKLSYTIIELIVNSSDFAGARDMNGRNVAQYVNMYDRNNTQLRNLLVSKGVDVNVTW